MLNVERKFKRCFRVIYKYHDKELNEKMESEFYFRDLSEVNDWLTETVRHNDMLEADRYGSRSDMQIIIKEFYISEKKFFIYFKD